MNILKNLQDIHDKQNELVAEKRKITNWISEVYNRYMKAISLSSLRYQENFRDENDWEYARDGEEEYILFTDYDSGGVLDYRKIALIYFTDENRLEEFEAHYQWLKDIERADAERRKRECELLQLRCLKNKYPENA